MTIFRANLRTVLEALWWRVLVFAPAAVSLWCLNRADTYRTLIFDGGWTTRFYVVAWILLTPYLGWFIMATGRLTFSLIKHEPAQRVDEFFVGAATLMLAGFGLGALSLLYPQIVLGSAIAVLLWDTLTFKATRKFIVTFPLIAISILGLWLLATVFLDRAVMPDVISTDVPQLYAPYLAEVARNHSIWLAADNPIFSDFEIGHGNGLHLLLATFLPPHVAQIISFLYFVGIGAVIFELARIVVPLRALGRPWEDAMIPIAVGLAVLGLAWPRTMPSVKAGLHIMEFGKYHLQTAAFFVYFLLVVIRSSQSRDRLAAGICGLAVAASYPLYASIVFVISSLGMFTKTIQRDRPGLVTSILLGLGALAGCILAFSANYFYLGIPATNPYSLFRRVVSVERFSQFGSLDILDFFVLAQSLEVSDFLSKAGLVAFLRQARSVLAVAFLIMLAISAVAFVESKLRRDRPDGSKLPPLPNPAGLFIVVAYVASIRLLDMTLNIPSLIRLSIHVNALFPLATAGIACWGLVLLRRFGLAWFSGRLTPSAVLVALLAVSAWMTTTYPWQTFRDDQAIAFVQGRPLEQMPRVSQNWRRCDELQQSTGANRILALNGYRAMVPCYFSPLLTRGKVIHTYESDVARDFRKIALGTADTAEAALRSLDVKLFYVQKQNCDFWLNGFSDLFQSAELEKRFALHSETPNYWLLTWKDGGQTLSPEAEAGVSALRARSKAIYRQAYGIEPFEVVKHRLSPTGQRADVTALDQLTTCH
ncbi:MULTISPECIES: hypothetical protein [unclassified Bradyrhizobium]|uniref:hypothetical protein n=1 Tax=unclassified Bradyrhizobium TaxID=2631580 RepID=UPI001FF61C5D|nr:MULTISPECIES: hypothetical protein [unclassified Bradyrhizobium]MCJ9699810.1 hypothetical protein [Bradyrhizobium sp. SHOUNA76]MCJ9729236.1 hypothetical protein [Bradyrhizobium sp. PRIMUS42]